MAKLGTRARCTGADLAAHFEVNARTIRKWRAAGMPVAHRGRGTARSRYDLGAVTAWVEAREAERARTSAALTVASLRKLEAQAIESEQRVALRAQRLIPADEAARIWTGECQHIRRVMRAWPKPIAGRILAAAARGGVAAGEAELREAVHALLTTLSQGQTRPARRPRARQP